MWHPDVFSPALYRFCHNVLVPSVYVFTVICTSVNRCFDSKGSCSICVLVKVVAVVGFGVMMPCLRVPWPWRQVIHVCHDNLIPLGKGCFFYQALVFLRLHFL